MANALQTKETDRLKLELREYKYRQSLLFKRIAELEMEIADTRRERDAAIEDLAMATRKNCGYCFYWIGPSTDSKPEGCCFPELCAPGGTKWKWRGFERGE